MNKIQEILFLHQDVKYADFTAKLVPNLPRESFIGVRSPEYKKVMKELKELSESEINAFLEELPHQYHEENAVHSMLISQEKDFDELIVKFEKFLPYITNWAISDVLNPKVFEKNHEKLIPFVHKWILSDEPYTKRVAMIFLKKYYLDEDFKSEYLDWAAEIRSEEYYVNMMTAWLFADALVKQWDTAVTYLQEKRLDKWTNNKTIQKARESFRITDEQKEYLKTLKM